MSAAEVSSPVVGACRWCGGDVVWFQITSRSKKPPTILHHLKPGDSAGVQRYCDDGSHVAELPPANPKRLAEPDVFCEGCLSWIPVSTRVEHYERCPGWKANGGRR